MDMKKIDLSGEWNYKVDECCHGMKEKLAAAGYTEEK